MTEIRGKVAFVTGGGSGIGRALASALATEGATVVVADILPESAAGVAGEIEAAGGTAMAIACDVSDRRSVRQAKAQADAAVGRTTLLFANAGATAWQRLTDMSDDDIDWIIQVDLMGVVNCMSTFVPDMIDARDGHALATSTAGGLYPAWVPGYHSVYLAAKMGVLGFMLNLRNELAEFGVGASVLVPGGVWTAMKENNGRYRPQRFGGPGEALSEPPPAAKDIMFASGPRGQVVFRSAEDVAEMVLVAIHENRPVVVTAPTDRQMFQETYVDLIMAAFDEVDAFVPSPAAG